MKYIGLIFFVLTTAAGAFPQSSGIKTYCNPMDIKYEHVYVASPNLAVSDIRVFGNGSGQPPATPTGLSARRDADPRNAFITWEKVPGAVGYN
ncbi:MAG: hypothetical protein ACRD68_13100, partial [Pyrinomonadaceae bacterium]